MKTVCNIFTIYINYNDFTWERINIYEIEIEVGRHFIFKNLTGSQSEDLLIKEFKYVQP